MTIGGGGRANESLKKSARCRALACGTTEQALMIWLLAVQLAAGSVQHYKNAKKDFAQKKFSEAVSEVDFALHENPYMVPALVLKARLATFARRTDIAKSCLITAITVDPKSEEAQFYLGVLFYSENDFKSAVSPLQAAQKLSPQSPLPVFYLAMNQEGLGNEVQSLDFYKRAESLASEDLVLRAEILIAYGRSLLSLGRTRESIEKNRQAIEIDPKSRDAHYGLAKGLDHEGDYKNAVVEGERALALPEIDTSDAQIHFLLATLYRKLNQPALAKIHLEKFLAAQEKTSK